MNLPRVFFSLVIFLGTNSAFATTVLPVSLEDMSKAAEHIFQGKVVSNEVKMDPVSNRVVTFTTFSIILDVKGDTGMTHTIKQVGGQLPGSSIVNITHGVPKFTIGEQYIVFLPRTSSLGFSSPIGLAQGAFSVLENNGISTASNGRTINSLLAPKATEKKVAGDKSQMGKNKIPLTLQSMPDNPTKFKLDDFIKTVRDLSGE